MKRLDGKFCVVSGAGRGIGAAISAAFAAEGARVLLTDKDEAIVAEMADGLGMQHRRLDVAEEEDWAALAAAHPEVDVVVNNAGITGFDDPDTAHDPENATLDAWRDVHRVNLDGAFLGCRYAIRAMRAKGEGAIVNIASRSGMVGVPAASAYAASKAAVRNLTKSVALYCAEQGLSVRCNVISPAAILTPMWEPMLGAGSDRAARMAAFVADTPLRRFGTVEEVAAVAVMLASSEAAYMTGAEVVIDGGLTAGTAAAPRKSEDGG